MKSLLIAAAALTLGGAAVAQNTPTTGTGGTQTGSGGTMQPGTGTQTGTDGTMEPDIPMQPDTPMQPGADGTMQPRTGMQTGTMATGSSMSNSGMMSPQPATGEYPRCSRTVTDRCMQGAGNTRPRRRR